MDGGSEQARLLDRGDPVERAHQRDRIGPAYLDDPPGREDLLDLPRRTDRREGTGMDQRDAMTALGFVEIVGGDEHGHPRLRENVDQAPELTPRQRIDPTGRLVEKKDRWFVE